MHHRRAHSHRRARRDVAAFDAIPEVPATGALIKVALPVSDWRPTSSSSPTSTTTSSGSTTSSTTSSSSTPAPYLQRSSRSSSDLEGVSNSALLKERFLSMHLLENRANYLVNKELGSVSLPNIWQGVGQSVSCPEHEVVGVLEAVGEDVAEHGDADLRLGDLVILHPLKGHVEQFNEYVCVRSLELLTRLPSDFPPSLSELLPTGVLWATNLVPALAEHLESVGNLSNTFTVLVTGKHNLLLWGLEVLDHCSALLPTETRMVVTVATTADESIMWFKKNRRRVNVVQWNLEAYEAVLLERTRDACRGRVDLVVGLRPSVKYLKRSIMCLKKGGLLLAASDLNERIAQEVSRFAERHDQRVIFVPKGLPTQWPQLMNMIEANHVGDLQRRRTSTSSESSVRSADQGLCLRLEPPSV